jgi:hypothetical protein
LFGNEAAVDDEADFMEEVQRLVGQDSDKEQIEMETRGAAHALFSEDTDMLAAEVQNEMMEDESRHCGDCTMLKERIKSLENQITYLQSRLSQQDSKQRSLDTKEESKGPPLPWRKAKQEANNSFKDAVTDARSGVVTSHGTRFSNTRIAQLVASVTWTYAGGICKHFVVKIAKEWLRKNVYTPWAILREMDLAGGTLSYESIEVLRRVETKGEKSVRGCVIPCPADISTVLEW